jgi:hypothetical protein
MSHEQKVINKAVQHATYGFTFSYTELLQFVNEIQKEERAKVMAEFEKDIAELNKVFKDENTTI